MVTAEYTYVTHGTRGLLDLTYFLYKASEKQWKYLLFVIIYYVLNARQRSDSLHSCDDALLQGNACYDEKPAYYRHFS